jgi:hypothetical protein
LSVSRENFQPGKIKESFSQSRKGKEKPEAQKSAQDFASFCLSVLCAFA